MDKEGEWGRSRKGINRRKRGLRGGAYIQGLIFVNI